MSKCKYRKKCEGYREESETCNYYLDCDRDYCGIYRKFNEVENE